VAQMEIFPPAALGPKAAVQLKRNICKTKSQTLAIAQEKQGPVECLNMPVKRKLDPGTLKTSL